MSGLPEALETAREAGEVLSAAVLSQENAEGLDVYYFLQCMLR